MQDKTNYCVIDLDEYKKLIYDKIELDNKIKEINEKSKLEDKIFMCLEDYFFEYVIRNESYHLENFKEYNDYHYIQLNSCFRKIGIDDNDYIDKCIMKIKAKFDENEGNE